MCARLTSASGAGCAAGGFRQGVTVVCDGEAVASVHNRCELDHDPSVHAEFCATVEAVGKLGCWYLSGCMVYVTLESCLMCAGLMVNSRIDRCVYGASDPKGGAPGTLFDVSHDLRLNHEFEATPGVLADESAALPKEFFQTRRAVRKAEKRAATRPVTSGSPDSGCPASPRESDGPEPAV
jgi:tRNA(adenine34) deaminase